jgi:hypothetical protein
MMGVASLSAAIPTDDHVFLLGRPPIGELLGFIRTMGLDGQNADQGALTQEWRVANDHLKTVEQAEAGFADNPPQLPLTAAVEPLAQRLVADPMFQQAYRFVPTRIALVELDRLVVFQKFINLGFVAALKSSLPTPPGEEDAARLAFGLDRAGAPVQFMQNAPNIYSAISPSNDFRFLEAKVLSPAQLPTITTTGRPFAYIVLALGFGSNYLNALQVEGRLVLQNGSHRAYTLRDLGFTHAPCVVQEVSRRDELDLVASGDVQQNPDRYLKVPRPPLLKDYFDPQLRKVVAVPRKNRLLRVQYGVEQADVPAT